MHSPTPMEIPPDGIETLLSSQMLCVVSTVHADGSPESALVAFSETPDGSIVFGTFCDSRKYANIVENPRISLVISGDDRTLQLEGNARVASGEDEARCRSLHLAKNPGSAKYVRDPKQRFIVVVPAWSRYTDYGTDPDTVVEQTF